MSYLALLKDLVASGASDQSSVREGPQLRLIINRSKSEELSAQSASCDWPFHQEKNLIEVIQWRVAARERLKRRFAGQVPGWALSKQDAAIYEGLIDQRCKRLGLNLETATADVLSVLSVHDGCINSKNIDGEMDKKGNQTTLPSNDRNTCDLATLPKPTKGGQ